MTRTALFTAALAALGSAAASAPATAQSVFDEGLITATPQTSNLLGQHVALDGDMLVATGPINPSGGSLFTYRIGASPWQLSDRIDGLPDGPIDLDGDRLVISQILISGGTSTNSYRRVAGSWVLEAQVSALTDADVALDGDVVALATGFEAKVLRFNGSTWDEELSLPFAPPLGQRSVALAGDQLFLGSPGGGNVTGEVEVYAHAAGLWTLQDTLTASAPTPFSEFGVSLDTDGTTLAIGASGEALTGAAYLFEQVAGTWVERQRLLASDPTSSADFGESLAVEGPLLVVGAPRRPAAGINGVGAVYVFERQGPTTWVELERFEASLQEPGQRFGEQIALSGSRIAVGNPQYDQAGGAPYTGAVRTLRFATEETGTHYCTAGTSALGCTATAQLFGTPSATADSGLLAVASGAAPNTGLFFFAANGRQAVPWGNGTSFQCVVPPVRRAALLGTGKGQGSCGGVFSEDLNSRWCPTCPKPNQNPGAGTVTQLQFWYRDPLNTSNQTTSLSDAVEFVVQP